MSVKHRPFGFHLLRCSTGLGCGLAVWLSFLPPGTACAQPDVPHLTNDWKLHIGAYSDCSPAIGKDGTIYIGNWVRQMWAINPNGTEKWMFRAGSEIHSSPAVADDGTIYFGCRDYKLYCVGPDGKEKWAFPTGGWVDSSAALGTNGAIYFGSWDKRFYALHANGSKIWDFLTGGPIDSSPAIDHEGRICFGSHDHKFYMLSSDGKKLWDYTTGGQIISSPALDHDGAVYFTSVDGYCYALNADGTLRWRLHTGGVTESSPVIGLDGVILVGVNKILWAITPDGKKKWERLATGDAFQQPIYATPVALSDGSILLISGYSLLTDVGTDLNAKWFRYLPGHGNGTPAVADNGKIYINNFFEVLALRGTVPLAGSPWPTFRGDSQRTGRAR